MTQRKVDIRAVGGRLVAVKSAGTELEVAALAHEADLLRRSAHPGVVAVVSFTSTLDRAELVLTAPTEYTVAERMPESISACLDFVAAIADIVADLHAIGVAHGAIRPDHVLVTEHDQPVLCGFGNAQTVVDPQLFSADVVAIGELLAWLARRMPSDARAARRVTAIAARSREPEVTARALGFAMVDDPRRVKMRRGGTSHRPATSALIALGAIATAAALFADSGAPRVGAPTTEATSPATTAQPASDSPRVEVDGVSYRVGQPGDLAFFVPCEGSDRVVVIRPVTGDLFVFDRFAEPGAPLTASSVGRVEGALEILSSETSSCSELAVATHDDLLHITVPARSR
jgi:serine/threonine protein kinase